MNLAEPFVLEGDVLLIPCSELSEDVRRRFPSEDGDMTLSRRHGRTFVQVIDRETASFLTLFREPRTLVAAVIENSRALGKDAESWLDELLPHLESFVERRVLVPAGSGQEAELRPLYDSGAEIAGWKVVRCVSLLEDTEIHQLRDGDDVAALKVARTATPLLCALFENEAAILRRLDGCPSVPRLLGAGTDGGRPYLILDWIAGVDASVAASQRRHDRAALIELCASIAAAYAALHARGVLHGDVHVRNALVRDDVTLLDFGYSQAAGAPSHGRRGGVHQYFEPEYFAARREGRVQPASAAGEQYAVAAMLYALITGQHYLDLRYELAEMERQLECDPPLPFAGRGIPPWPEVERILFRALEKDPARRHESMAEMAALLGAARDHALQESLAAPVTAQANAFLEATLQSFARGGTRFAERYPTPPTASINYGCAGAAVGLLMIAERRGDPALLALADVWRSRAAALIGAEGAYYNAEKNLSHETLGDVTPYHTESGIHAAAAMVAHAMGDVAAYRRALAAFVPAASRPCDEIDLTLGRSGALLAAAMLLALGAEVPETASLRAFGAETLRGVWTALDAAPPIGEPGHDVYLGMAHGWAGYLYAALRWCAASGDPLPGRLPERLEQYALLRTSSGRGVYWRTSTAASAYTLMPGWCNGSAGQVFLFTLAHRLLGDDEWLRLAELSAWHNWDASRSTADLCCGMAGRAYALLNLYKHTGERAWLSRARQLGNDAAVAAVATSQRRDALWKGELGVAVLVADLASPENARMPFFE